MFLVGSYSDHSSEDAIYIIDIDNNNLILKKSIKSGINPSYIIPLKENRYLALNEIEDDENLSIIDLERNSVVEKIRSQGIGPCHIHRFLGDYLAISNYTSGSISLLKLVVDNSCRSCFSCFSFIASFAWSITS